jgi:predicted ATPase
MRIYYQNGQRSQALTQYNRCRQLLWDELGVIPSTEMEALYQVISEDRLDGDLVHRRDFDTEIPNNLPRNLTSLVGRSEEIAGILDLIADKQSRLITITGFGGTGKTRLALAVAEHYLRQTLSPEEVHFPDGIYFVPLVGLSSADQIPVAIANALQINLESGFKELLGFLSRKKLLITLDNFEHLLDGVDLIVDVLESAPQLQLLITSRERLRMSQEQVIHLLGLPYPQVLDDEPVSPAAIVDYESIELFTQRARLFHPNFEVLAEDLPALAGICQYVAGLPLALELAAGWVDSLPLKEIEAGIKQDIDFLTSPLHDQPARHRSMRTVFNTTWERLPPVEQTLFARSSVFRGGFTGRAAQRICDGSLASLASLVRKSFVSYDRVQQRYHVHELLRQFGEDLLEQDGEAALAMREKHAHYFCEWVGEQGAHPRGLIQSVAFRRVESDLSNVLAATQWALDHENVVLLQKVIPSLEGYFMSRSRWDGKTFFQKVADALSLSASRQGTERVKLYSAVLTSYSGFLLSVGEIELAQQLADTNLAILRELESDTRQEQADLQHMIGYLVYDSKPELAQAAFEESIRLYEAVGDDLGQAAALWGLGRTLINLRKYGLAEHAVRQCLIIGQRHKNRYLCARAVTLLGWLAFCQDHTELAEEQMRKSLAMIPTRYRVVQGYIKASLGFVLINAGKFTESEQWFLESIAMLTEIGDRSSMPAFFCGLAKAYLHRGDYENAERKAEEGYQLALEVGQKGDAGFALYILGAVDLVNKRFQQACFRFQESKRLVEISFAQPEMVDANLSGLGMAVLSLEKRSLARQHLISELTDALETQTHARVKVALFGFALLYADEGKVEEAIRLHALVNRYPYIANSRWFADIAGDQLMEVAAELPALVLEEIREQGRNLDLWEAAKSVISE